MSTDPLARPGEARMNEDAAPVDALMNGMASSGSPAPFDPKLKFRWAVSSQNPPTSQAMFPSPNPQPPQTRNPFTRSYEMSSFGPHRATVVGNPGMPPAPAAEVVTRGNRMSWDFGTQYK